MAKRGRPPNKQRRHLAESDRLIASAVHRLLMWGVPSKAAHEAVAHCALAGWRQVGPDRVKQIYRAWLADDENLVWRGRSRYAKGSLLCSMPPAVKELRAGRSASSFVRLLAEELLKNPDWPEGAHSADIVDASLYGPNAYEPTALAASKASYWPRLRRRR